MDKKFLTFLMVISLQQFQVTLGQLNVEVTFTVDSSTTTVTTATLSWTDSESDFTDITYSISIEPSGPTFETSSGDGSVFSSASSTGITGLSPGAQYTITVTFTRVDNNTQDFPVGPFNAAPKPPSSVTVTAEDEDTLTVTVTQNTDNNIQDGFKVYSDSSKVTDVVCNENTLTMSSKICTFDVTVDAGAEYTVYVVSKSGSSESTTVEATGNTAPKPPTNVVVTAVDTATLNVSWTPETTGNTQKSFVVYTMANKSASASCGSLTESSTSCAFAVTGNPGESHTVYVVSVSGTSESEVVPVTGNTKPGAPTSLGLSNLDTTSVDITWVAATDSTQDAFVYSVTPTSDNGEVQSGTHDDAILTKSITNLVAGEEYTFAVQAISNGVLSDISSETFTTKPASLSNLQMTTPDGPTTVTITWDLDDTSIQDDLKYTLVGSSDTGTPTVETHGNTSTSVVLNTSPGEIYTFTIYAVSNNVLGAEETLNFTTKPLTPTITIPITRDTTSATVIWTAGLNSQEDKYVIELTGAGTDKGEVMSNETAMKTMTFSGLASGFTYTVNIMAKRGDAVSDVATQSFVTVPLPPTSVTVSATDTSTLVIMWVPTPGPDNKQDTFLVYIDTVLTNCEESLDDSSTACTVTVTDDPGHQYSVEVKSQSGNESSTGVPGSGNTKPLKPTSASISAVDTDTITVTWIPATTDNVQDGFVVYLDSGRMNTADCSEGTLTETSRMCSFDVTGKPGASHTVYVVSKSGSSESDTVMATGNTKPPQIGDITTQTQNVNQLILNAEKPTSSVIIELVVTVVPQPAIDMLTPSLNDDQYVITINGLIAGTNHAITVTTKSGDETGTPKTVTFSTKPAPPTALDRKSETTNSMVIGWGAPTEGNFDGFTIVSKTATNSTIARDVFEYAIPNLMAGNAYAVTIYARANGLQSDAVEQTFRTKPNSPQNIQFTAVTAKSFTVTWDAPLGQVTGYDIEGNEKGENETTQAFTERQAGKEFTIILISKADDVTSDPVTASVVTLPNPASDIQVGLTTTSSVTFSWTAPVETDTVTGYRYTIVAHDNALSRNITTTDLMATESGLYAGEKYDIKVWVYTQIGSHPSKESSQSVNAVITLDPEPPTGLTVAEKTTTTLRVTWTAPTNTIFDRFKYKVYKSGETVSATDVGITELTKNDLEPGHTYTVDVWTEVDDSNGDAVESVHRQISVVMVPESPSNLRESDKGRTTIDIAWKAPSSGTFTEYRLTVTDVSDNNVILNSGSIEKRTETYQQTNLYADRTYKFSLVAVSVSENSEPTEINIKTNAPTTPDLIVSEASPTSIVCTWAPADGEVASNARVQVLNNNNQVGDAVNYNDGTEQHTFTSLTPGQYYSVELTLTINNANISRVKDIALTPLEVSNFMISAISEVEVELTWDIDTSSHQDEFVIDSGQQIYTEDYNSGASKTRRISGLNAGGYYRFKIHAKATHAGSSKTSPDVANTVTTRPRNVKIFTAVADDEDTVTLTWEPEENSNQTSYRIWFESLSVATTPSTREFMPASPETSIVIDNFFPGAEYMFHIKTRSGDVESQRDDTDKVRLFPLAPSSLDISVTTEDMTVSWNMPSSVITDYRFGYTVTGSIEWTDMILNGNETSKTITGLVSGQHYTARIFGQSNGKKSAQPTTEDTTLKPIMTAIMTEAVSSTKSNEMTIEYTEETATSVFDEYIFSINQVGSTPKTKAKSDTNRKVIFSGLTPGSLYTVSARTKSGEQTSTVQSLSTLTVPGTPTITCEDTQKNEITIHIGRPVGGVTNYVIDCTGSNCETTRKPTPSMGTEGSITSLQYQSLIPFNSYTFRVAAYIESGAHEKTGGTSMVTCETVESAPEEVETFELEVNDYDITLRWTDPLVKNGLIRNYILSYEGLKQDNPTKQSDQTLDAKQYTYTFNNLVAGYRYTFTIQAVTTEAGKPKEKEHFFPILAPAIAAKYLNDRNAMKPKLKKDQEPTETDFMVQLVNPFTNAHGNIVSYSVIVATSDQELTEDTTLLKWSKAQEGSFDSPYIAINECRDLFEADSVCRKVVTTRRKREAENTVDITIGGDQSCTPETTDYCNGKLSPNTNYYVLLRAYTETGLHADTPFSTAILTAPKDQTILIAVVCAVVAALIFIIVIVLVVILVRRKKRRSDDDRGTVMGPVSQKSSFKEPEITSIPVKIDKFDEHVTHMSADSDFRFAEEYEDLKQVGRDQSWSISELPVNRPKNRFTNILPYDHSRVKLLPTDDEEGSDYINANWMPGYNSKREFIVTQGALPATTDDFWRMMWEQNSRAIVMLTKCVERGREKCHHYWPVDSEPIFYGDLQVTVLNETKDPEWVITEFKLAKGEISRKVLHFHYTAWPDFDVPEKPQSLINFVRIVRGRVGIHGGPITVHCSAGVGRSGTYICIDRLLQVIQNTDVVDIYGIVYEMRRERCFMVQTERQYICIHQCLLCVIKGEDEDPENVYENGQVNPGFEDDGIVMD